MDKELAKYIQEHGLRLKEKKMKAENVSDAAIERRIMEAEEPAYDPKKEI